MMMMTMMMMMMMMMIRSLQKATFCIISANVEQKCLVKQE